MKKVFYTFFTLLMVVTLITACNSEGQNTNVSTDGTNSGTSSNPLELTLWMPPFGTGDTLDKEVWSQVIAPFEDEHNAKVNIEIVPWDNYEEKYLTAISSGQGPDVGYMYLEMIAEFIDMGALEPFDSYLTDQERDNFYYLDKGNFDGKQYGMPIVVGNPRVMFYNKDVLKESGVQTVPTTWEEFLTACKLIKSNGFTPFQQQWNGAIGVLNSNFYPFLWQAGGEMLNEAGNKAAFNSPEGIKAAKFLYDMKSEGIIPDSAISMTEDELKAEFMDGKTGFIIGPTNFGAEFNEADLNWDYITSLKDQQKGTFIAADSLVLLSQSKNKDLAAKLVKHMLSGPSMTAFHEMAPYPPIGKDEEYNDVEAFKRIYEEDREILKNLPAVKGAATIFDRLYRNLQSMMMGELTPEEALSDAENYANDILSQN